MEQKICVIGLGYIGLPNAAIFAENGYSVIGVDINEQIVKQLNNGIVETEEEGLVDLVQQLVTDNKLRAETKPQRADVFIVAVPTPHDENFTVNLDYVKQAIHSIVPVLEKGNLVIVESTIPPRTTRDVIAPIIAQAGFDVGEDILLAHCPERVLPGKILIELYENSRTVGGINERSTKKAATLYRSFVRGKIIETTAESAEMSKLMENTYRSVNIALANELTKIAATLEIDPIEVIALANEHPRVNIHQPGPGVGGHCIAVDPYFIVEKDEKNSQLIRQALEINESMPGFVVEQVKKVVSQTDKIALFGLAYKGNIDDVRDSPAVKVAKMLKEQKYRVDMYDPFVRENAVPFRLSTMEDTLRDASLLIILTDHNEFKTLDWDKVKRLMNRAIVFDTKNCVQNDSSNVDYYSYRNIHELRNNQMILKSGR